MLRTDQPSRKGLPMKTTDLITRRIGDIEMWDYEIAKNDSLTITVHAAENETTDTGLVDANGTPLRRTPRRNPIGFIW